MSGVIGRLRARFLGDPNAPPQSENDVYATRLARRKTAIGLITRALPAIRILFYLVGYLWMVLIPFDKLSHQVWVDENALQPGQVTTYWAWSDVHAADTYLGQIESLHARNASSQEKASYIEEQFVKIGLKAGTQSFSLSSSIKDVEGVNAYGVYPVPRASGAEAIVISASWLSRTDEGAGTPNQRGVALLLALARYLSKYSLWAKDLIFVVNDGHMEGMHAWLNSYHGLKQANVRSEPLQHTSGVIWTALCLDYPGHSFSHLGVFYEGLNGRLPNQDLLNSVVRIAQNTGGVPVVIYDHLETTAPSALENVLSGIPLLNAIARMPTFRNYMRWATNVKRHVQYEALNRGSGVHGLFHKFRIDAITIFAVPSLGPYGFHTLGQIVESSLRTMNNLLERLHASFFFYILTSPHFFVNFGGYLASAILVSVAMIFGGLRLWVVAGWEKTMVVQVLDSHEGKKGRQWPLTAPSTVWRKRERPVLKVLGMMLATHFLGWLVLQLVTSQFFASLLESQSKAVITALSAVLLASPLVVLLPFIRPHLLSYPVHSYHPRRTEPQAPLHFILKAFNLYISSIVISITSVLNFSLAASLAVLLGLPLTFTQPSSPNGYLLLSLITPMGLMRIAERFCGAEKVLGLFGRTIWEWEVLGAWFLPFACVVYLPLVLQAMIVCLLPKE